MAAKTKTVKDETLDNSSVQSVLMVNPLLHSLRENDKKNHFKTNVKTVFHKTGFHLFDYYFGSTVNVHDADGNFIASEPRVGQTAGTLNMIIGNTGSGKTTMAVQIAGNIIRQFPYSNVIHYDCEQRFDVSRGEVVSKLPASYFSDDETPARYMIRSGLVGMDTIQEMVVKTSITKMKLKDKLTVNTGYKDEFGKDVTTLQPTVIIIDSITSVISETFSPDNNKDATDAEKMRGNTEGARDAKSLKGFFKDLLPLCKEANIIIYAINHISTNMSMNAFVPVAKQQNFLKQDESIPGGKTMLYYPFNIIKLVAKPSDDFTEEADGFAGHMVMVEPIKSSSNQSGNNSKGISFQQVFSFKYGFDPLRTLILYAKDRGIIEGNKTRLKFRDDPSCVFSLKNVNKELNDKPIWENLKKYVFPVLTDHLSFIEPEQTVFDERSMDY